MAGKHTYHCPVCETDHDGWAMWRHHVTSKHRGNDPRYPEDLAKAVDRADHPPTSPEENVELMCPWPACFETRFNLTNLRAHMNGAHGNQLPEHEVIQIRNREPSKVADEMAAGFAEYLGKLDEFNRLYPDEGAL